MYFRVGRRVYYRRAVLNNEASPAGRSQPIAMKVVDDCSFTVGRAKEDDST